MSVAAGPYKAALCQMSSTDDPRENLDKAGGMVALAAEGGARIACLPEMLTFMGADAGAKRASAERPGGPAHEFFADAARKSGIFVAAGSVLVAGGGKMLNRSLLFAPDGSLVRHYDKIHLFRYEGPDRSYDESSEYDAGSEVACADTELGRLGLSVCYDLRFPELYRAMSRPDVILVPSAFTRSTGEAHWETLLRARAIENQCYVLAAAQCGSHPGGLQTWGHSMAVDPWGKVVGSLGGEPGLLFADVDPSLADSCRKRLPSLDNRVL